MVLLFMLSSSPFHCGPSPPRTDFCPGSPFVQLLWPASVSVPNKIILTAWCCHLCVPYRACRELLTGFLSTLVSFCSILYKGQSKFVKAVMYWMFLKEITLICHKLYNPKNQLKLHDETWNGSKVIRSSFYTWFHLVSALIGVQSSNCSHCGGKFILF